MDQKIDTATIVRNCFALVRANLLATAIAIVALAAVATAVDGLAPENPGLSFVIAAAAIFAQYGVTRSALRAAGLPTSTRSGGSFVGALILSGLGIAIGFVFLILPGLYLWARWSLVSPLVVGEGMSATDAMGESWARTQTLVAPISAALLVFCVPFILCIATLFFYPETGSAPLGLALLSNLLVYGAQALIWNGAVAIHGLIQTPSNALEEVFA